MAEMVTETARLGQPAPDFTAIAYADGDFKEISLSDYRGKWVILFLPRRFYLCVPDGTDPIGQ